MAWLNVLYQTYENLSDALAQGAEDTSDATLYPIGHTTQQAQIEVTVSARSEFVTARVLEKNERETLVPCTEASASRGGTKPPPHPLFDKLQYVAGDYALVGGGKGSAFHEEYQKALHNWVNSPYATDKLRALSAYLDKGTLMQDLIDRGVLVKGADGRVPDKWDPSAGDPPDIYKAVLGSPNDAFVRFCVTGLGTPVELWRDVELQRQYVRYIASEQGEPALCYVTGQQLPPASSHPYKIRHSGDKAKLISANDNAGFTYRGRFTKPEQAAQVGFDVTQKAHNALKYLIAKQGRRFGERVYVTWNPRGLPLPDPTDGAEELEGMLTIDTGEHFAIRFNDMLAGYLRNLTYHDTAVILGVDAATTGRMSLVYYREMPAADLIANLEDWQTSCAWRHECRLTKEGNRSVRSHFVGVPSPRDIALAAYGHDQNGMIKADDKLIAETISRILPCIAHRAAFPGDIAAAVFRNLSNPLRFSHSQWLKMLTICCSLTRKRLQLPIQFKEDGTMAIYHDSPDVSYHLGRWLAVADAIERRTFGADETGRETNAIRYFSRFLAQPFATLQFLRPTVNTYLTKLGKASPGLRERYEWQLREISNRILELVPPEKVSAPFTLSPMMTLGFDSQRYVKSNESKTIKEDK